MRPLFEPLIVVPLLQISGSRAYTVGNPLSLAYFPAQTLWITHYTRLAATSRTVSTVTMYSY